MHFKTSLKSIIEKCDIVLLFFFQTFKTRRALASSSVQTLSKTLCVVYKGNINLIQKKTYIRITIALQSFLDNLQFFENNYEYSLILPQNMTGGKFSQVCCHLKSETTQMSFLYSTAIEPIGILFPLKELFCSYIIV